MELPSFLKSDPAKAPTVTVDGNLLVVPVDTTLPARCIQTNNCVSEKSFTSQHLYWCSPIVGLLIVPTAFLFLLVYLLVRKKGIIKYGLAPDVRARRRKRMFQKSALAFVLFFTIPIAATSTPPLIGAALYVIIIVAIVLLLRPVQPLRVVKYTDGRFWLSGCSQEFLAEIEVANKNSSVVRTNE